MTTTTTYIPKGLSAVTPYLLVSDVDAALEFYKRAFGAEQLERYAEGGRAIHAKIRIDRAAVELGRHGTRTADDVSGLPSVGMHLYVPDVDAVLERATAAGARAEGPATDQPYGDREATITDPFGVVWFVATQLRD